MTNIIACPFCGQPVDPDARQCPQCGKDLAIDPALAAKSGERGSDPTFSVSTSGQMSPEILVPRLGDYLVEIGVLLPEDLERARQFQSEHEAGGKPYLLGQSLLELGLVERDALDEVITKQLLSLQAALRDTNRQLELRVRQRTRDLERRIIQIRATAEVTQIASSASTLDELLARTVHLLIDRLGYYLAAVFLVDEAGKYARLAEIAGPNEGQLHLQTNGFSVGSQSTIGWVTEHNQARIAANIASDPWYLKDDQLPDTKSEAAIPISMGDKVLGVLDIKHTETGAFDSEAVTVLQTIANHLASAIQNFRLLEMTQNNLKEISSLYQASQAISNTRSVDEVFQYCIQALKQSSYIITVLQSDQQGKMHVSAIQDPESSNPNNPAANEALSKLTLTATELNPSFQTKSPLLVASSNNSQGVPPGMLVLPNSLGCKTYAFIPVIVNHMVDGVFLLGSREEGKITLTNLQPYASLAELAAVALEKLSAEQKMEKRLAALQTLSTISQAVSVGTDLSLLYKAIHDEVRQIMGNVGFSIAIYDPKTDMIQIPYMFSEGEITTWEPFPLGEGLTSILIRTRQPLMLVEDTENRAKALGAKIKGKPAQSWLGVPLIVSGDATGAIIVQDSNQEKRFDDDDMRLLSTLATQVAVVIRNARLLENTHQQAERERLLYTVSSKIRGSTDMQTILETTARELGKALGVRRARIELGVNLSPNEQKPTDLATDDSKVTPIAAEGPSVSENSAVELIPVASDDSNTPPDVV